MFTDHNPASSSQSMSKWLRRIPWLVIPVLMFSFAIAHAQQLTGTLSGIVADQTDARVPGANVVITNEASGDTRSTKADAQGFFSVTALIPGKYKVQISAKSFASWEENGVVLNQGDSRTIPNIRLKIGSEATAVTVISGADAEVPVDTAEVSATLNNELVDSATLTGRNAAELIKMMPGVTFTSINGANGSGYNSQVTGTNNGPAGDFSANGTQPYGSTAVMLDGAMLVDPGNAGTQIANINQDMTDSVKYLSASYGAEYAKGPAVLQAFSKSGGQKFHGEGYLYARNTAIGYANDWYNKQQEISQGKANSLTPQSFYYIGGNVGGPVFFPHFNHNRDKLFFWAGYEKMIQHPYNPAVQMNVPTDAQRSGDFTNPGLPLEVYDPAKNNGQYPNAYRLPCSTTTGQGCNPAISPWVGGSNKFNPSTDFDPAGVIVVGLNPKANQTPTATNGWNNFAYSPVTPQNRWEVTGKVNYSFNDNNKLWGSYTLQEETDAHPLSVWWAPPNTIPYPGDPIGKETAHVYLANYTHVFSATTTNEFVFAYAEFVNNTTLSNPSAVSRKALGFPTGSLFGSSHAKDVIPDFQGGWEDGINWIGDEGQNEYDSGIYGPNTFGKTAKAPNISDTFTKIVGTHAIKAGFYWDTQENLQSPGSPIDGVFQVDSGGSTSTQNETLDQFMGRQKQYYEQNSVPIPDYKQHQWSIWGQDSWKATRKLTLNLGLRADHIGQWYDTIGGTQVWDPSTYDNSANAPANTGLQWNKINPKIATSGWESRLFTYNPRVGFAYDVFGTGRTVVRSGFGTYRYQVSSNDAGGAMVGPLGSFQYSTSNSSTAAVSDGSTKNCASNGFLGYNITNGVVPALNCTGAAQGTSIVTVTLPVPTSTSQNGSTISADALHDDKVPTAHTWSFGVAQALPGHTVAEVSYVGSASRNQLENGGNGHISDANPVPYGSFFLPNPISGVVENPAAITGSSLNSNDYRPLRNYGDIWIQTHGGYANYNSLQISAQKQSGNLYLFTNFTFGKVLGTRDGSTSNGNGNGAVVNPFSLDSNYGPLQYDHTKVFNFSASYKLPNAVHNRALGEIVNGWQLSNYTTYEDGAPYQAQSVNMNASYSCIPTSVPNPDGSKCAQTFTMPSGLQTQSIGNNTWFGTSQYENGLQPVVVCDPRKGLLKNQYFNPNCFAAPLPPTATSFGQAGQIIWPYIRTPHYFGSDLAIFKAFRVNDSQRVEVRVSATNWLNHANAEFGQNGNSDNQLNFVGASTGSSLSYNTNASTTGIPSTKSGYRWMQFAAKYYF